MRDLAALTVDDFRPLEGTTFLLKWDGHDLPVVLTEVTPLGRRRGDRDPFSLLFRGTPGTILPQQIHHLSSDGFGELELFLVPVGADADAVTYEAVFT
ncbi:MAG TPA: hypothetical protein VGB14_15415 [Acidimicrobiales bacterium]